MDFPDPDGPRMARRWLRASYASRRWNVPAEASMSKLTGVGGLGSGGRAAGSARWRRGTRIWATTTATAAAASTSTVGAWVLGIPAPENCTYVKTGRENGW